MEALLGPDPLTEALRAKVRELIETLVDAELTEVLAAVPYQRSETRRGYRHGRTARLLTTGLGATRLTLPRARLDTGPGTEEWQSQLLRRYQRRAAAVDAALLGTLCSGANSRRLKGALRPLLRGAPLSKSAVSRVVRRVQALFEQWRRRPLQEEGGVVLYLDAIALRVRLAQPVTSVPVLVAVGVRADGQKGGLDLELLTSESTAAWQGLLEGLLARGLRRPQLCVIDGNPGLRAALASRWPGIAVQRCTVHKLRNLQRHAPRHAHEELRADDHRIVYAESEAQAREAYRAFLAKWEKRASKVAASLREAGDALLTFSRFPVSQWKVLRTTNAIERLHGEFRRRVKTQGALPPAPAAAVLFFALLLTGQIQMRRIDGWRELRTSPATEAA